MSLFKLSSDWPSGLCGRKIQPMRECLHSSRGSIARIVFIFPLKTLCFVYTVVCLVRHMTDFLPVLLFWYVGLLTIFWPVQNETIFKLLFAVLLYKWGDCTNRTVGDLLLMFIFCKDVYIFSSLRAALCDRREMALDLELKSASLKSAQWQSLKSCLNLLTLSAADAR